MTGVYDGWVALRKAPPARVPLVGSTDKRNLDSGTRYYDKRILNVI
jgi:hypothetical protein